MLNAIDIVNIGYFIASVYLSPLLFYYYKKTKIVDYLIFSAFYLNLGLYAIATLGFLFIPGFTFSTAIEIQPSNSLVINFLYYLGSITPFIFYFLVIFFFGRGIDTKIARILIKFDFTVLIWALIMWVPLFFDQSFFWEVDFQLLIVIRYIVFLLISTPLMVILIDGLIELRDEHNYYFENRKMEIIWKIAIWFTIMSSVGFLAKLIDIILEFTQSLPIDYIDGLYVFSVLSGLIGVGIVILISIFNPKGLLVFRYQIVRAVSIYQTIEKDIKSERDARRPLSEIYAYVNQLTDKFDIEGN